MRTVKLLFAALFAGMTIVAQAQTISGKLTDEANVPLEYVNVILLTSNDSIFIQGTVTDANGGFKFDHVNGETYILKATSVGYETVYMNCRSGNMGTLILKSDAVTLQEAVVTASLPTYKMKGNSLITNVANSLLSMAGTAKDVLARIPFVQQGNEGGLTVFGKGTPLIYINGRQVRDVEELGRLNSNEILNVEVITNPGAEYDATVKSVIRIKTVKPKGEGVSVTVRSGVTQAHNTGTNNQIYVNYRHGGLDLFAGATQSLWQSNQQQHDKHYVVVDTLWQQDARIAIKGNIHNLNTENGFNYIINENHSIGARYEFNRSPKGAINLLSDYEITTDGVYYDKQHYDTRWSQNSYSHKVNAYYKGMAGKLDIDLNVDFYSGRNYKKQHATESSEEYEDRLVTTNNMNNNELYAGKLILTYPIGKGELKVGAEYSHTDRKDLFENPQNYLPETNSHIVEEKMAGFTEFATSLGKLQALVGLRYEHVASDYYNKGEFMPQQSKNYNNMFPNIGLSLPIDEVNLALSYTAKTQRPSYEQLRSDLQYNDRFTYEGGNPLLQPEVKHDLTFMASYKWMQLMFTYVYRKDAIEFDARSYEKNQAVTIFTRINYDHAEAFNAGLSLSPKIGIWQPAFNIYVRKPIFEALNLGEVVRFNKPTAYFNWNNSIRLTKTLFGNLDANFNTGGNFSTIYQKRTGGVSASLYKTFLNDQLSVDIRVNDIFASQRNSSIIYGNHMAFDKWNYSDSRNIQLTIRYKFNSTKSKYRGMGAANEELQRM